LTAAAAEPRPPNLVVVLADDLGWGDLGSYGQERFRTPRLDGMAAEGLRFTQYYAGSTVCAPSRAALVTGRQTGRGWIRGNGEFPLRPEDVTIAEVLKARGYATAVVGKWGLGLEDNAGRPDRQGFDFSYGILHHVHAHRQDTDRLYRNGAAEAAPAGRYVNDLFTEEALRFVRESRDRPFFLYLAYTVPHAELRPPEDSLAEYRGRFPETPFANAKADAHRPAPPWEWSGYRSQPHPRAAFAASVTRLDRDVGRLLDLLDELGLVDETLVLFTSDNGPHREGGADPEFFRSAGPLRGIKRDLYEGGIRVPMIARRPGLVPAGRTSDAVWAAWDLLPTLADLAGAPPPPGIDGVSQKAVLLGGAGGGERPLYWEFFERGFDQALRLGRWKGVRHGLGQPIELYDLLADPSETRDLAPSRPDVVARIERSLREARIDSPLWPIPGLKTASPPGAER
jgi:arylsulfatase A-like enzyme